jgi:hypothetical protein
MTSLFTASEQELEQYDNALGDSVTL